MHTREQAIAVLKRLRNTVARHAYIPAIFGSTVLIGEGRDIDVQITSREDCKMHPLDLAMLIVNKHAKHIYLWDTRQHGEDSLAVTVVFETHDKLYIDMHIRGVI